MPSAAKLSADLRHRAAQLGFDLVGITSADPLEGAEFYARWMAHGYAGEMHYLERNSDKRADPRQLVPGARSVICVGMHYDPTEDDVDALQGRIASYALGDDYHELIKSRLAQLWQSLQDWTRPEQPKGRYFVDTAPVLERELAARAGLGWWGKNTCLISSKRGSYFLLGEIVSSLELQPDSPATDQCGSCTRCLDACPTDAFPEPYLLDARRCISYLTIELKGTIPHELRSEMGNWVFGCDICQNVCPWNHQPTAAREPSLAARPTLADRSLEGLARLNVEEFRKLFRRNPVKRPKRRGFLRNVAVALGNSGRAEAIPALVELLEHEEEPLVRAHAAWALGQLGGSQATVTLQRALVAETDPEVLGEIEAALVPAGH